MSVEKPRICIIGFGRMGKAVLENAKQQGFQITAVIDPFDESQQVTHKQLSKESLENSEVCIDFSNSKAVLENIRAASENGKNIVVGTTGWNENLEEAQRIVEKNNTGLIFGGNFSIGVNCFYKIIQEAAKTMKGFSENYDCYGFEMHHKNKTDSPSGTAREISRIIIENYGIKSKSNFDKIDGRKISAEEFHFASIRAGAITGTHEIGFDSEFDNITIRHSAKNRNGFAQGALKAAQFINAKKGVFEFSKCFDKMI